MLKGIDSLAQDFFANRNVCEEPKNLKIGDKCFIVDTDMIGPTEDFYAIIPVEVIGIKNDNISGRVYYWFRASGSMNDEVLNNISEIVDNKNILYYKFLESTSPYILLSESEE